MIITEVFVNNEYNFTLSGQACVIDVGMNVGIASLYLASRPFVEYVHSFEPFKPTFERACENLALNETLSQKVTPYNCGLSGADSTNQVLFDDSSSIGISTRGVEQGRPETIQLRNAGDVFSEIIGRARAAGLQVVVKLDCEGSEFPIFEQLTARDLLSQINVFIIEWHRWWSSETTQDNLIRPLLAQDFVVFDQTAITNPHAGLLYAVRRTSTRSAHPTTPTASTS